MTPDVGFWHEADSSMGRRDSQLLTHSDKQLHGDGKGE
jgi:hypothetical protein